MNPQNPRPSRRFQSTRWSERLVPVILVLLLIALIVTILVVAFSMLGLTPGA